MKADVVRVTYRGNIHVWGHYLVSLPRTNNQEADGEYGFGPNVRGYIACRPIDGGPSGAFGGELDVTNLNVYERDPPDTLVRSLSS